MSSKMNRSHESLSALPLGDGIRERYLNNVNGLRVHVLETGFETPGRPALLLLHGFPDLAFSWRKVMKPLADAGYHVIAPDQRGYGRTTGWDSRYDGDTASFSNHTYARDAIGVTLALGYREVACVVGHDFGAAVAAYCALTRPDYFRSLILMSYPFDGVPPVPLGQEDSSPQLPSQAEQLSALTPPRKDSMAYLSTREANEDMLHPKQGLAAFLRGYFYLKSADNPANHPHPLASGSATELATLPTYYIMNQTETMPATVALAMADQGEPGEETWLTTTELTVYSEEFHRTGFQGALNWFRCNTDGTNKSEIELFIGRTIDVPSCFIAGEADWGIYRKPGAFDAMKWHACARMEDPHLIKDAGHWVQQEKPEETVGTMLIFLRKVNEAEL